MAVKIADKVSKEAKKDILGLENKIGLFKEGMIDEDRFKLFRLTRGVYGQRQLGVQMIRIKLPYGKVTCDQMDKMADVSDKYATGNLHLTTRQDIQLHYVKLDDSPAVWAELEEENITLREACGNTVRNITASSIAGIDPNEPFDVSPYAQALSDFLLRNPFCQDMGRKIKPAFSSSEKDSAFTFMHDIGFIPRIKDGKRGFKVVVGGGLGAQAIMAQTAYEFVPIDEYIPLTEAFLRVFDRHGERVRRHKARIKFLIKEMGLEPFLELVEKEKKGISNQKYMVAEVAETIPTLPDTSNLADIAVDEADFQNWVKFNVFEQKQKGYYAVGLRVQTGDINFDKAKLFTKIVRKYAADDIRVTINQGLLLRYVTKNAFKHLYNELKALGLTRIGFDAVQDITTCPGTDTCNLGVTNSMGLARILESVVDADYPELADDKFLKIKMSGCMNACGQHMAAQIGFHGSSIKVGSLVAPAMQVVLGGGVDKNGVASIADKIVKVPTKRIPEVLRTILSDFKANGNGRNFNTYYKEADGDNRYFYNLLKPIADTTTLKPDDFVDWEREGNYSPEIGVGECAGVTLDVIGTVIGESQERLQWANEGFAEGVYADAAYNAYSSMIIGAKGLLLSLDFQCNSQASVVSDFQKNLVDTGLFQLDKPFGDIVFQIQNTPSSKEFSKKYIADATAFQNAVLKFRSNQVAEDASQAQKQVIDKYYKA